MSKDKFESWPYITKNFYLLGFKTISPDTRNLQITKDLKIIATYDNPETLKGSCRMYIYEGSTGKLPLYNDCQFSDGIVTVKFSGNEKMDGYIIYSGNEDQYKSIILYNVKK